MPTEGERAELCYGSLYSIGLGSSIDKIDKEYKIQDLQKRIELDSMTIFNIPNQKSVGRTFLARHLPFYTTRSNYKYYIIKYKVVQSTLNCTSEEVRDTGYYYHMAIPINGTEDRNLTIKYERS